jgi:hypothetical protein
MRIGCVMTKIMLSVAGWRVFEISQFCRIRQQTPGIRHNLPHFDLMKEANQISEAFVFCCTENRMYVLFLPSHFCSSHFTLQSVCNNLHRNMHRTSNSLTSSSSAGPNSVLTRTCPRLYLRKGQVAHSAMLCYF